MDVDGPGAPLSAYQVVGIFAEYKPASLRGFSIRGEVNNLLDESYASRATYGQEWTYVEPLKEPGRSFKVVLSYRF